MAVVPAMAVVGVEMGGGCGGCVGVVGVVAVVAVVAVSVLI